MIADYQWVKAHDLIERFIDADIKNQQAQDMRQKLRDAMKVRKRELFLSWKTAVRSKDIDKSLVILRELDKYLTPKEGLALQKTVRKLFRKKLDELAKKFTDAVTYKQWLKALQIGSQIIYDFPNSKIAHQIEGKMAAIKSQVAKSK